MRRIWLTLGALALLMLGLAVVRVVVIVATWPTLSEEEQFQPIHAVAFFPDGFRFATMNNAGPVRIWDVKTGKELKRFTPGGPNHRDAGIIAMAVSGDGRYLAGASNRGCLGGFSGESCVHVWDVATERVVGSFSGHSAMVNAVVFTPDGRCVLSAGIDKTIRVWDIATGREIHCLRGHESHVNALAVTPDGRYVISGAGDYDGGQLHDPTIRMWELETGSVIRVFEGHSGSIDDISVSPDGELMASVSWDTSLRIWDLSSGEQMQTWRAPRGIMFNAVSFSANGKNLLTGSADSAEGAVQLWDVATGQELRAFGMKTITHDVAFSPDGKTLVSAQEITVPAPPPPFALMYAEEFRAGIAVVSEVESAKELLRVGEVPRQPAKQQSKSRQGDK